MKTLTIKDLARSEHLDRPTMAAVRGGWRVNANVPASTAGSPSFAGGAQADKDLTLRDDKPIVRP
jgi:hypothetical protein